MKRRYLVPLVCLGGLLVAVQLMGGCQLLERWFGPPAVELREAYASDQAGPSVDHGILDRLLARIVTPAGRVRYDALRKDPADLDAYLTQLENTDFDPLARNEKLALLINAYNAFTLRLILDHWPMKSIRDIPADQRWDRKRWRIGELVLSLTEIENDYLRRRFLEPRIHFAINCASIGCPPLRRQAYRADRLEQQLQSQSEQLHASQAWLALDQANQTVRLTRLYLWFAGDFEQAAGTPLDFAARFHPNLAAELAAGRRPGIEWIEYDWRLNSPQ